MPHAGLPARVVKFTAEVIDFICKVIGMFRGIFDFTASIIGLLTHLVERFVVGFEFTLETVKYGLSVVELDLPVLRAGVIFTKGFCTVFKCSTKRVNLGALRLNLFTEHLILRGQRGGRLLVLPKRGSDKLHL